MLTVVLALFCGPSVKEYCCRYGRLIDAPVPVPLVFHTIVERWCSLNLSLCSPVKTTPSRLLINQVKSKSPPRCVLYVFLSPTEYGVFFSVRFSPRSGRAHFLPDLSYPAKRDGARGWPPLRAHVARNRCNISIG